MIKLKNVDKYFNKGKENQIHVINQTSLELPKQGFVTLLGESGSGKTTLLNVIGGLDKANGTILFKDLELSKYDSNKWAEIRNKHIGYIFQNYYLLEDKTVYDNIKIVLEMLGINDVDLIEDRIKYVLEAVGMYRFKNRTAGNLSGGQKQRVAIARALVKNPDVIIADEPTGNLDSNNSIEVMKIIKEISKEKLVVLVTHNTNLANNYSDRIINIKDGKVISDLDNIAGEVELDYIDHNIYLKDLKKKAIDNINIYSNNELADLELTIIKINNNYYLKTNEQNITLKDLSKDPSIKLIDEHKVNVQETFTKETSFDASKLELPKERLKNKSVYSFKDSFIEALKKVTNLGRKGKLQIISLIALGVMFTVGFLMLYSSLVIDQKLINVDQAHYAININRLTDEEKTLLLNDDFIIYSSNNKNNVTFTAGSLQLSTNLNFVPSELINKTLNHDEAIIDKNVLSKNYSEYYKLNNFGITDNKHLLNQTFGTFSGEKFKIIETTDTNTFNIYIDSDVLTLMDIEIALPLSHKKLTPRFYENNNIILSTKVFTSNPENPFYEFSLYLSDALSDSELEEYAEKYKIAGLYQDDGTNHTYIKKADYKKSILYQSPNSWNIGEEYYLVAKNNRANEINNKVSLYDESYQRLKREQKELLSSSLSQTLFAVGLTILIFFFLVRSSLTSRIKEISILRSLGLNRWYIIRLYAIEYAILTTFTSLIGLIVGAIITNSISESIFSEFINIRIDLISFLMAFVLIYIINIITGLIPLIMKLRQTPAEMLTSYDI